MILHQPCSLPCAPFGPGSSTLAPFNPAKMAPLGSRTKKTYQRTYYCKKSYRYECKQKRPGFASDRIRIDSFSYNTEHGCSASMVWVPGCISGACLFGFRFYDGSKFQGGFPGVRGKHPWLRASRRKWWKLFAPRPGW
jgi:hypothetical protein